jgi:hypothetical protein
MRAGRHAFVGPFPPDCPRAPAGFIVDGTLSDHRLVDGCYVDELRMSVLRREIENTPDATRR